GRRLGRSRPLQAPALPHLPDHLRRLAPLARARGLLPNRERARRSLDRTRRRRGGARLAADRALGGPRGRHRREPERSDALAQVVPRPAAASRVGPAPRAHPRGQRRARRAAGPDLASAGLLGKGGRRALGVQLDRAGADRSAHPRLRPLGAGPPRHPCWTVVVRRQVVAARLLRPGLPACPHSGRRGLPPTDRARALRRRRLAVATRRLRNARRASAGGDTAGKARRGPRGMRSASTLARAADWRGVVGQPMVGATGAVVSSSRSHPWAALLLGPALLLVFARQIFALTDPDYWWHVRTGQYIYETGAIPHADFYSFTAAGQPWIAHEWLAELLFYVVQ